MIGKEILGYHVDEKIGSGGFGTVYKVSKTNAAGTYIRALKHITLPTKKQYASVLNSMGGDYSKADDYFASALNDIVNEIKILSSLSESGVNNIVRYYENDIIETPSPKTYDIYILMEYLTPFSDYTESKDITVKDVITLGKDILHALISCHEKNIIHRDIKDDNIFVAADGTYKLGDFGVSKVLKDKSRAESVKGTPNFIAPEVYLGKEKYDNTVDVYSLGIVLYRLLNKLRNPFLPMFPTPYCTTDEDVAFEARMTGKVPELPIMAQNELGQVIVKAIMPRNQRYNSAKEFLSALEDVERNMNADNLSVVTCEVIMKSDETSKSNMPLDVKNKSSEETIGMTYVTDDEEQEVAEDKHLFDTFSSKDKINESKNDRRLVVDSDHVIESTIQKPIIKYQKNNIVHEAKKSEQKKGLDIRKWLIFGAPLILLLAYVSFYMILIPQLYGKTISFVDWFFADVNHIVELLRDINNILVPAYVIILLIILQYLILGAFLISLFFAAKELHKPKVKIDESVKYTGKLPQIMLENIYVSLKGSCDVLDRNAIDTLRTIVESMKYSKSFGITNNDNVTILEREICQIIDDLQEALSLRSEDNSMNCAGDYIMVLKQKNSLRDSMLKK